jgi:hypothetical protein
MRRFVPVVLTLLAASPASAAPNQSQVKGTYWAWDSVRALAPDEAERVDALGTLALDAVGALPETERAEAILAMAGGLARLGRCERAERLLALTALSPKQVYKIVEAAAAFPDQRRCADRVIGRLAEAARQHPGNEAGYLYYAGALWRRMGEEAKGAAALAAGEAQFQQREAAEGRQLWTCHGGNCLSPVWGARLHTISLYRGTPLQRPTLEALTDRALALAARREADRGSVEFGDRVFEVLLRRAVEAGEEAIAARIATKVYSDPGRAIVGVRMDILDSEGRYDEATKLWPEAHGAFIYSYWGPRQVAAAAEPLYLHRERLRQWVWPFQAADMLVNLAAFFVDQGDLVRAREALRIVDSLTGLPLGSLPARSLWLALKAWLDPDPFAALTRLSRANTKSDRAAAWAELATRFAVAGRWTEFERALKRASPAKRQVASYRLVCRTAGKASAEIAVKALGWAGRQLLRPGPPLDADEAWDWESRLEAAAGCLLANGLSERAFELVDRVADPKARLEVLARLSADRRLEPALRRRLADRANGAARAHALWGEDSVAVLAGAYERLGDRAAFDRLLADATSPGLRYKMLREALDSHLPPNRGEES